MMNKLRLWLVTFGVSAVLLFLFSFQLTSILYAGAGGVVGGAIIPAPIILVQYLCLLGVRRLWHGAIGEGVYFAVPVARAA